MRYVYIFLLLAVTVLVALFAGHNSDEVRVAFFTWSVSGPLSIVVIAAMAIGMMLGILIMLPSVIGGSFKHLVTRRKLKRFEKEDRRSKAAGKVTEEAGSAEKPPVITSGGIEPPPGLG
jgi:uncharacterized integral membrane protein